MQPSARSLPPAALASDSAPTPELEKSYSFKTSSENSLISTSGNTEFGYLYDYDDDVNLKSITLVNFNDGSSSPIAIPEKSLDSAGRTHSDQLIWLDGNNLVIFSPDNQTQTVHPIFSNKYTNSYASVSEDGERAAVWHEGDESELKEVEIYDLKSDKLIKAYQAEKDDYKFICSNDMSRLYILQANTGKGVVALKVFNCDTGSTELKTISAKNDDRSSDIEYINPSFKSEDIYLQSDTALIKADRDGNMSVLFNDDEHASGWFSPSASTDLYFIYIKKAQMIFLKKMKMGIIT